MKRRRKIQQIWYALFFLIAVAFNFVWEMGHEPLYISIVPMTHTVQLLLWVSVKDAFFITLFAIGTARLTQFSWIDQTPTYRQYILLFWIGFVFSTIIEHHALTVDRWGYVEAMPLIPFLGVGLSPVIQMSIGPFFIVLGTRYFFKILSKKIDL